MAVSPIGSGTALPQSILDLRDKLIELQTQLGTGRKAATYGGLGSGRSLALGIRGELSRIESFRATITTVNLRLDAMGDALQGIEGSVDEVHGGLLVAPYEVGADGKTQLQHIAGSQFSLVIDLLNSQVNDRYLFSGRESDGRAVANDQAILYGAGGRAGLSQVVAERGLADAGVDGLGRLAVPAAAGATASVAEDAAGHPFGFKLTGVTSTLTGTTVTGPAGSPAAIDVTFSSTLPAAGEEIVIGVALPDGTTSEFRLTATTEVPPPAGTFTIGADENATAANFETALRDEIARVAAVDLAAASAVQASHDFFDFDAANPPQRLDGPPFESATALVDATATDTVFWYEGDLATPARQGAVARIDASLSVDYGARADEAALRNAVRQIGLIAVQRFDASVATDSARNTALKERLTPGLSEGAGAPKVSDIATDLAQRQVVVGSVDARHKETLAFAQITLDETEGVDLEETGARFLRLQTQLQASYEATSILSRLSLVNFL